ncbi:CTP synthetase [bacterium]|nr:CTP synthetase [bacterium]
MRKYIFVFGGVMSGVGKGIVTASIGKVLQFRGYKVTAIKIDPYVNVDAGTMNPTEHGEVFVTNDGDETDQDVGNYERFLGENINSVNYMTTGRVYQSLIQRERNLEFGGKCVSVVPHVPEEVIRRVQNAGRKTKAEIVITEIGGTVGDYQNILFLEAARMMRYEHPEDVFFALVSYLPIPDKVGEMKSKPTQHAVKFLNSAGIQPDMIFGRSEQAIDGPRKEKLSTLCSIPRQHVISAPDVNSIYEVPLNFEKEKVAEKMLAGLGLRTRATKTADWAQMVRTAKRASRVVRIGMVGKYFATGDFILSDSYISVIEALKHAATANKVKLQIDWLNSDAYEKDSKKIKELADYDGLIVPGGFGTRGIEGKIKAISYARQNKVPYFGLCYGMQLASIEFARNVAKIKGATTEEMDSKAKHQVIHIMPDQAEKLAKKQYGNTMRLGAYPCALVKDSKSAAAYGKRRIDERHRHRYEFNNAYRDRLAKKGLVFSGMSPDKQLVEIIELKDHPFFVGTQFHPEFKSRPLTPHPLFKEFIKAADKKSRQRGKSVKISKSKSTPKKRSATSGKKLK